jgi:hypothetical protein
MLWAAVCWRLILILVLLQQLQHVLVVQPVFHVTMASQDYDILFIPYLQAPRFQPTHPSASSLPPMYEIQRRGLKRYVFKLCWVNILLQFKIQNITHGPDEFP